MPFYTRSFTAYTANSWMEKAKNENEFFIRQITMWLVLVFLELIEHGMKKYTLSRGKYSSIIYILNEFSVSLYETHCCWYTHPVILNRLWLCSAFLSIYYFVWNSGYRISFTNIELQLQYQGCKKCVKTWYFTRNKITINR